MVDFHELFPNSGQGKEYPWLDSKLREIGSQKILDYGAGKGGTTAWLLSLGYNVTAYDPYWPKYANTRALDQAYDTVFTADVLEHILTGDIPWQLFAKAAHGLHIIDLTPAKKLLPTGENAHINLASADEWCLRFVEHVGGRIESSITYDEPDRTYGVRTRLALHWRAS